MSCPGEVNETPEGKRILSNDDIMDLVHLKRNNPKEYKQTLKDITEVLRDIEEAVKEVYNKPK